MAPVRCPGRGHDRLGWFPTDVVQPRRRPYEVPDAICRMPEHAKTVVADEGPVELGPQVVAYARGRIVVLIAGAGSGLRELGDFLIARHERVGEPLALVVVVPEEASRPGAGPKTEIESMLTRCRSQLACMAMLVQGSGFLGSFLISLASGVLLHTRRTGVPVTAATDDQKAARWVGGHLRDRAYPAQTIMDIVDWALTAEQS